MRKIFILGLDSAPPKIIYQREGVDLPILSELIDESQRYIMQSCYPPITVPAWMAMFTGKTPGELGIYGFRHRKPGDIKESYIVNSKHIKYPTIWEEIGKRGYRVGVVGVPPTYPPKPIHGFMITDFTTPGPHKPYTFPPWLKKELEARFGPMIFDVTYRSEDKKRVAQEIYHMLDQHMKIVSYLLENKKWDFFTYVEIGVDRVHHAFWRYYDKKHPRYKHHPEFSKVIPKFYEKLDGYMKKIKEKIPKDTIIITVSDHGAKAMKGAFAINQWLIEKGFLKIKKDNVKPSTDLSKDIVDLDKTIAWAWGGYYSRLFINLKGREPKGTVEKNDYDDIVDSLKKEIMKIRGPNEEKWKNMVFQPHELYPVVKGDAPDLMVFLDNLDWRPAGTIGWTTPYLKENDRGPDDMVHDWNGVFAVYDPENTISRGDAGSIEITKIKEKIIELIK